MASSNTSPGLELLGKLAFAFAEVQPLLPLYTHLILSALFPIFTGAFSSLSRPSSAAKPSKNQKGHRRGASEQDDEDDESSIQKMEGLSPSDAVVFPVLAGCTLGGLYLLIKYMGAGLLNKILRWYFSVMALASVAKLVNDGLGVVESFFFPHFYTEGGVLWEVKQSEKKVVRAGDGTRASPLPGILGRVVLPRFVLEVFWSLRGLLRRKYTLRFHLARVTSFKLKLSLRSILSAFVALIAVCVSNFVADFWWLTNLQGFAFSYSALQLMSPTTFGTGSLILSALFFYDIYFVFYTPLMVTVATKLDVPIKLLFPRPVEEGQDPASRKLAMLGLGDVVIPGMMIGLALRFDLYMFYLKKQIKRARDNSTTTTTEQTKETPKEQDAKKPTTESIEKKPYQPVTGHWGNKFWTTSWTGRSWLPKNDAARFSIPNPIPTFPKPYFYASVIGYVLGMCATLAVMQVYRHAQPALLYLVPGVLSSLWLTALIRGEIMQMWEFSEASEEEESDENKEKNNSTEKSEQDNKNGDKKPTPSSSWWNSSFFSSQKTERNAKIVEAQFAKSLDTSSTKEKEQTGFFHFSLTPNVTKEETTTRSSSDHKRSSSFDSDEDAVLVTESEVVGGAKGGKQTPRWRGSGSSETKEERAGKRRRI